MDKKNGLVQLVSKIYRQKPWNRAVTTIAAVIIFVTTYMLILPAITMTGDPVCGMEEHIHSADCYTMVEHRELVCPYADSPLMIVHKHDESCYRDGVLVCPLKEVEAHTHTTECYGGILPADIAGTENGTLIADGAVFTTGQGSGQVAEAVNSSALTESFGSSQGAVVGTGENSALSETSLSGGNSALSETSLFGDGNSAAVLEEEPLPPCGKKEVILHTHDAACYDELGQLICTRPEVIEHQHTDACFHITYEEVLICGLPEHQHTDACYETQEDMSLLPEDGILQPEEAALPIQSDMEEAGSAEGIFQEELAGWETDLSGAEGDELIPAAEGTEDVPSAPDPDLPPLVDGDQGVSFYLVPQNSDPEGSGIAFLQESQSGEILATGEEGQNPDGLSMQAQASGETLAEGQTGAEGEPPLSVSPEILEDIPPEILEEGMPEENSNGIADQEIYIEEITESAALSEEEPADLPQEESALSAVEEAEDADGAEEAIPLIEEIAPIEGNPLDSEEAPVLVTESVAEMTTEVLSAPDQEGDALSAPDQEADALSGQDIGDNSSDLPGESAEQAAGTQEAGEAVTEQSAEWVTERAAEQTTESALAENAEPGAQTVTEQAQERKPEGETEATTESGTEAGPEHAARSEQTAEAATEPSTSAAPPAERNAETVTEQAYVQVTEIAAEETTDEITGDSVRSTTESAAEQATEWTAEGAAEQTTEWTAEHAAEQATAAEWIAEDVTGQTTEWAAEHTVEQTTEWTAEDVTELTTQESVYWTTERETEQTTETENETTTAVLEYQGQDYKVRLTCFPSSGIPQGACVEAEEILPGDEEGLYETYLAESKKALGLDENTKLSEKYARFFDIRILDQDRNEIEPTGPVKVEILYDEPVEGVGEDTPSANVLHFDDESKEAQVLTPLEPGANTQENLTEGSEDGTSSAVEGEEAAAEEGFLMTERADGEVESVSEGFHGTAQQDEALTDTETDHTSGQNGQETPSEMRQESPVEFTTDGFSVYGVVYTVDFTYESRTWSFPGEGSFRLADILAVLGIDGSIDDAALTLIEGEDHPGALYLTQNDGEYYINSDVAFFDTYELRVTVGAKVYLILVTDLQYTTSLNDVLTDLTIIGAEWDPDTQSYTIKPGKPYTVNMTFEEGEETDQYQFSNTDWMTLNLPDGVTFGAVEGTFDIYVNEAGENYTIHGNQIAVENGTIKIKLNEDDPNYQKLKDLTTAQFSISVTGVFSEDYDHYEIEGQTHVDIKIDKSADVDVKKSGSVIDWNSDPDTAIVRYQLEVRSNGNASGVVITDTIQGTGLRFNENSIRIMRNGQPVTGWETTAQSTTGFTLKTGDLQDGQTYIVEYTATLNKSELELEEDGSYSIESNNKVDWLGKTTTYDLEHIVDNNPHIKKTGSNISQFGSVTTTRWTIEADSDYGDHNQLKKIKDKIVTTGVQYSGAGLHVVITDRVTNAEVGVADIPWSDLGVTDSSTSWEYDFSQLPNYGNKDKKYHYVITYTTECDLGDLTSGVNIKNDWEDEHDHEGTSTSWVNPDPENRYDLKKEYTKNEISGEDTIVTWTIRVTVPASGVPANTAVLTETLPFTGDFQDTFVKYSDTEDAHVAGLLEGESFVVDSTSQHGKVLITFTNDGIPGLKESTDGKARTITLILKTKCDPLWLADNEAELNHKNHVEFAGHQADAIYTRERASVRKEGWRDGKTENGLPKFTYNIVAGVFTEDLFNGTPYDNEKIKVAEDNTGKYYVYIEDTFDSRLAYVDGSAKVYGGFQYWQGNGERDIVPVVDVSEHKITFKFYRDSLPTNAGNLYQFYRVSYSLMVKDQDTLNALRDEAIAYGKPVELGNTVEGFGVHSINVEYEPDILDKKHEVKEDDKLEFTITVNQEGLKLSNDGVLVLTDKMENLSVRYQDISIAVAGNKTVDTMDTDGNPVTAPYFNMKGDTITFYLPDEAPITITYRATPRGEVGADGKIYYSNTVRLKGFEKKDSGNKTFAPEGAGYGTNYGIYIYKADGLVNSNALAGAVFKLYEADEVDADGNIVSGTPVKRADGSDYTVTTSDGRDGNQKGVVLVMGNEELGWNLKPEKRYYLLEVKAPEGYALDNTKYSFIISKEGYVNYTSSPVAAPDGSGKLIQAWTYHNGDVLTVKNWRKEGVLTLEKSFVDIDPSTMDDDQKSAIRFKIYTVKDGTETLWRTINYDQFSPKEDGSGYAYTIGDLPEGTYKVVETVDDVTCTVTTYRITDEDSGAEEHNEGNMNKRYATIVISRDDVSDHTENKVSITNTYDVPSEFKIYKHAEGEASHRLPGAKFGVFEVNADGQLTEEAIATYTTNSRGRFTILQDQENESGQPIFTLKEIYALKETEAPDGFLLNDTVTFFCFLEEGKETDSIPLPAGVSSGDVVWINWKGSAEQSIEDTPETTYLEAEKKWLNNLLEDDDTNEKPVNIRVKQIASLDQEGKIIEPELTGYYYSKSPSKPLSEGGSVFKIVKTDGKWHLEDVEGIVVNGRLINLPTMIFKNSIPYYFTYEVEEIVPEGYVPRYEYTTKDGGIYATVFNRPNNVKTTIQLKAQKKWMDVNGDDVTGKMGLDDGVKVGVYRYEGVIKSGTIYEQGPDGTTTRDPMEQFIISMKSNNVNGRIDTTKVICLPNDRIEVRITPVTYWSGGEFNDLTVPTMWGGLLTNITDEKDEENRQLVKAFTPDPVNLQEFIIGNVANLAEYTIQVKNLTAEERGRRQVLTQSEVALLGDPATKVEILELNKLTGWSATSREYPIESSTVPYYSYFLVEENGEGFDAIYSMEGDVVRVTNVEKKIEVQKIWKAANGVDDITDTYEDGSITFTLYRSSYYSEPETVNVVNRLTYGATWTSPLGWTEVTDLSGDLTDIKIGSDVSVTVTIEYKPNQYKESENPVDYNSQYDMTVSSAEQKAVEILSELDGNKQTKTFILNNIKDTIVLQGNAYVKPIAVSGIHVVVVATPPEAVITTDPIGDPVSVGSITVTKDGASFTPTDDFKDIGITAKPGSEVWSAMLNKLPAAGYNDANEKVVYKYSVKETTSEGFEPVSISRSVTPGGTIVATNKLKSGSLKVKKVVEGAAPYGKIYEIAVTDAEGNYYGTDGTNYGSTPHYEEFHAGDEKTWTPLTPGTYTVSEKNASVQGYTWTVSGTGAVKVQQDNTANATVTNSYFKNAEYIPKVTKSLKTGDKEFTPWPDGISFDFYLSFVNGNNEGTPLSSTDVVMTSRNAQAIETNKTAEFGKIEFKKPGVYNFKIEEVEPSGTHEHRKDGVIYSIESVTLTIVVGTKSGEPGVLEVKSSEYDPADETEEAGLITNTLNYPSYAPSVTKVLKAGETNVTNTEWGDKSFTFTLANTTTGSTSDLVIMPGNLTTTVTRNSINHKETFDAITFKAAGDYTFTVTETIPDDAVNAAGTKYSEATDAQKTSGGFSLNGVTYDGAPIFFTVTVAPDSDGNLEVTKVTVDGAEITGENIIGSGVTVANTVEKTHFEFNKIWLAITTGSTEISSDDLLTWPTGKSITVRVFRKNGETETAAEDQTFELIYTISDSGTPISPISGKIDGQKLKDADKAKYQLARTTADNITTFITGVVLDEKSAENDWVYYVEETGVPEGYDQDGFGTKSTTEADGTTITKKPGAAAAAHGEVIMNRESSGYELPATGGPGTRLFTILGSILILGAGVLLWRRRKLI